MRTYFLAIAVMVILALTNSVEVRAENQLSEGRPKIGLVLAGGGAKGAAHVGVIKLLEEIGVPIDYIAGTSMGAIVGGLYASGMSSDELENAVRSIDWDDIFDDKPARENRDFRRKLDDEGFLVRYKLGISASGIQFPRGVIDGQKLNLALRSLSKRAFGINDFDKLSIPFRAVAADIETGETVVLGSGDLAQAMRASMAVSGVFPPVEIDGRLLVDGGLSNNLPMDIAREMGSDILIVVNFQEDLKKRQDLNSAVSIVLQSLDLLIIQNSRIQLKTLRPKDIYMKLDLGEIGSGSFDRAEEAILIGERAAQAWAPNLRKLALYSDALRLRAQRPISQVDEKVTVDFIRIENNSRLSDEIISSRIRQKPGEKLEIEALERDISDIFGLDYFETVEYQIVIEQDKTGIVVSATEKSAGLNSLRFGLNLENDFDGDSAYNLSVRYQIEAVNELGGELVLQANVGENLGASVTFLQPLDPGTRYFLSPSLQYLARNVPVFENGSQTSELRVSTIALDLIMARQFANWGALSLGTRHGWGWRDVNVGSMVLRDDEFTLGEFFGRLNYDTFDNLNFPNSGAKAFAEFRRSTDVLGAEENFNAVSARASIARTWDKNTILLGAETGITFNGTAPTQNLFELGGLYHLSGFQSGELTGQDFAIGRLVFYRNIGSSLGPIDVPVYIGASLEAGNVWQDQGDMSFSDLILAGSAFLGIDTPLGPLYLAFGHADGGNDSAYLFLGQTF